MNDFQRTSLAEFSRLYLRAMEAAPSQPDDRSKPTAPSQVPENSFAAQVVLGMSKNNQRFLSPDHVVRLIG
jgi:hypothetical protein